MGDIKIIKALEKQFNISFKEVAPERITQLRLLPSCEYATNKDSAITGIYFSKFALKAIPTILSELKELTCLTIKDAGLADISALSGMRQLHRLFLFRNNISDVNCLGDLENLHALHLGYNQIEDISVITSMKHLKHLNLSYNQIENIEPIRDLKNLELLDLKSNPINHLPRWIVDFNLEICWAEKVNKGEICFFQNPFEEPVINSIKQGKNALVNYLNSTLP